MSARTYEPIVGRTRDSLVGWSATFFHGMEKVSITWSTVSRALCSTVLLAAAFIVPCILPWQQTLLMTDKCCSDVLAMKKRRTLPLEMKLDVIKRSDKGEILSQIGRLLDLYHLTTGTIIKDKTRMLQHIERSAPIKSTIITKQRSGVIADMEKLLEVLFTIIYCKFTILQLNWGFNCVKNSIVASLSNRTTIYHRFYGKMSFDLRTSD